MVCRIIFILISIFSTTDLLAQSRNYIISGRVKGVLTGKIYLYPGNIENIYFTANMFDTANIVNGRFTFKRSQNNAEINGFRLYIDGNSRKGSTDMVFITPRNQYIYIDSINEYIAPIISNCIEQREIRNEYNPFVNYLVKESKCFDIYTDSIYGKYGKDIPLEIGDSLTKASRNIYAIGDSLFFRYGMSHTNSLVTLWKLIERFNSHGYKMEYKMIYNSLGNKIKNVTAATILMRELDSASKLSIHRYFPSIKLKTNLLNDTIFDLNKKSNNVTIIDFWFSRCTPCLKEFPKYKELYETYKDSGLLIIGISIDDSVDIGNWKKTITTLKLPWPQYLDLNGSFANAVSIKIYPTNYLLNERGKIIAKNVIPSEVECYLKKYLKQQYIYDKLQINVPY